MRWRRALGAALAAAIAGTLGAVLPLALAAAPASPPLVRPPSPPWLLGNTQARPPRVSWTGPSLVVADSPEVLTGRLLRSARGGSTDAHLLYADQSPHLSAATWVFAFVRNATARPVEIRLTVAALHGVAFDVRYARGAAVAVSANGLTAGMQAAASLLAPGRTAWGAAQAVRKGKGRIASAWWRLPAGDVLSLWWPLEVTSPSGALLPYRLSLWETPNLKAPKGGPLPRTATSVARTTLAHVHGTVTLTAPVHGAWAYDLDNDAPTLGGGAGGSLCPTWVCQNGEVESVGGTPLDQSADPLPGELQGGVDALDAPGRAPAVLVRTPSGYVRTGNYGDYGTLLTLHLRAPRGRVLHAAVVPGFNHASPWAGETITAGKTIVWRLPTRTPPLGMGYQVASGARVATIRTTMVAGAYAPWRLVLWSTPAPKGSRP